jgi:hypothetical protein
VEQPRPHSRGHPKKGGVTTKSHTTTTTIERMSWAAFWSHVRDTLAVVGCRRRTSRRRNKLVYVRQQQQQQQHHGPLDDATSAGDGTTTHNTVTHRTEDPTTTTGTSQVTDEVSLCGGATTTLAASSSSSFPIKNVLLVVSLPVAATQQQQQPPVVDYGNAAFLSMEHGDYSHSLPLQKKWVSDNGSVSSISTVTMDPAVQLPRDMRLYPHYHPQQQQQQQQRNHHHHHHTLGKRSGGGACRPAQPRRHTVYTMDAILCDDSKTNCCSSITMITEENDNAIDPEAADLAEIARVPLVEI